MPKDNGGKCPGGCAGAPCGYVPETIPRILPVLGWAIYSEHKGLRLRFPDGSSDYMGPRERQAILALEQVGNVLRDLVESPNAKANNMWDRARAAVAAMGPRP